MCELVSWKIFSIINCNCNTVIDFDFLYFTTTILNFFFDDLICFCLYSKKYRRFIEADMSYLYKNTHNVNSKMSRCHIIFLIRF